MSPVYSATGATNSYRLATGGVTAEDITATQPQYNRLSRAGDTSRAWYSTDGFTWTELGSQISFTGGLSNPVTLGIHLAAISSTEHWVEVDWFRIRKYAATEPLATVGPVTVLVGYFSQGTLSSQVLDAGAPGAIWNMLIWDETLIGGTDINFEVRASDTFFLKDAATPSWVSIGGTSPVMSGLPSGRYMQWRVILTTSDSANTPSLHEVRLYYY